MWIEIIDSGVGGALIYEALEKNFFQIKFTLFLDEKFFPYGEKELTFLKERLVFLIDKSPAKMVLIGCNTLSSLYYYYGLRFTKKVVDVIGPTVVFLNKMAAKKVMIFGTKNTIKMAIFSRLLTCDVVYCDASEVIQKIQYKTLSLDDVINLSKKIPFDCDAVVLGCTHLIEIKEKMRLYSACPVISQDEILIEYFRFHNFFHS